VVLFVLVVAVFFWTGWFCTFMCRWPANSGFAVEVNRKYLCQGK